MDLDAFPTRVKLMAEYGGGLPLWDESPSPGMWFGPFDRGVLGLPDRLETRLVRWNERFDTLMGSNQDWPSAAEHLAFVVDGHLLAADLQRGFGAKVLVLYLEADAKRSRVTWPQREDTESPAAAGSDDPPSRPRRMTIVEQMWEMPDADFAALTRTVDVASLVWQPGRVPTRILLRPQAEGLPLLDRSPLVGRASDRLEPPPWGFSDRLVGRLREWSDRWHAGEPPPAGTRPDGRNLEYLIEGHALAAAVQQEVGPEVAVLFPEADAARSAPSAEMQQFVNRLRARGGGGSATAE